MNGWGFDAVNRFARATPWLHTVVYDYASYGIVLFAGLLAAGWWIARTRADARMMASVLAAGIATLLAVAINQPIVSAVHEARPYTTHPTILVLAARSSDFSFPSDHAVMAGAVAAGLWLASRRLGVIATVAALAMAFARVYIAAHYPQDVLAGLALGAIIALLVHWASRPILTRALAAAGATRLRPLITARAAAPVGIGGRPTTAPGDPLASRSDLQAVSPKRESVASTIESDAGETS